MVTGHGPRAEVTGERAVTRHHVALMSRANCPACDTARDDLARICAELGVPWSEHDVDADPELRAGYGDRVPVILVDGVEHGFWRVEEERLRRALITSS
jgi:glutaredoxin